MSEQLFFPGEGDLPRAILSESQARTFSTYQRAKQVATEKGVELEILDDEAYDLLRNPEVEKPAPSAPDANGIVEIGDERVYRTRISNVRDYEMAKSHAAKHGATLQVIGRYDADPDGDAAA